MTDSPIREAAARHAHTQRRAQSYREHLAALANLAAFEARQPHPGRIEVMIDDLGRALARRAKVASMEERRALVDLIQAVHRAGPDAVVAWPEPAWDAEEDEDR